MALFGGSKKNYSTITVKKRDVPDGLWMKCPSCGEIVYKEEVTANLEVCIKCGHHFTLPRQARIELLSDEGTFTEWAGGIKSVDTLGFTGKLSYIDKLEANQKKSGWDDAVTVGGCTLDGREIGLGVMDFSFLGASMGSVVGERITYLIERCTKEERPVLLVCASGGARMYEGLLSLMQMAKTSAALARHAKAKLPFIPILTHPTMAGVMASFATLGDLIVAEPEALIGFAGPRVIKETIQQDLPEGFQRSEFLQDHGLIDKVIPRSEMREQMSLILDYLCDD
ncbi:acetyl-CoA carboxylase, carboxyltransferase subunit beta [Pontiella agarivorans]|uniref:Acetyl-coenzyme A carboxylase carboxyl transferase subunit beta n=1 Tax=Pontiella agarivorans TaxID=3038953 RepID=A0ABU5MXY2_9BACT|nr:acetyl-CoA carboxylase, carboxyltransferase subunit beta [Pontiella agarivorans]MDZ8119047.1 acetyl-CoA carboxylase, carboxyltransferase subunit beta [Pontiella agarivorans]